MSVTTKIMPDAPSTEVEEKPKKSRKKLLMVAVPLLLVILGAGGFVGKGMLAGPAKPEIDPKTVAGGVVTLDPITLNLADGRYLKLTLALQLSEAATPVGGSVDKAAGAVPAVDGTKALDAAIGVLGPRTYAQLIAPGGRVVAQKALSARVRKLYDGVALGVYFKEFLMQ